MLESTIKKYLKRKIKQFDDSQDEKNDTINYFRRSRIHWLFLLNILKSYYEKDIVTKSDLIHKIQVSHITILKYIKEAAVIGLKDKFFGEVVFAVCVTNSRNKNIEAKTRKDLQKSISRFQMPLGFSFINKLPKNNLGKIQKYLLRKKYNEKKYDFTKSLRKILNK